MKSLTSIETYFIVKELKVLEGARLDKIFQQEMEFVLKLYKLKSYFLDIVPGHFAILSKEKNIESEPSQFCMALRKYLTPSVVQEVIQVGFQRIIEIKLKAKEETYSLIIELFSTGNLILSKENKIVACLDKREFKDRKIFPGLDYKGPPSNAPDITKIDLEEFSKLIDSSKKENIVKSLAIDAGLGGVYAEEVLHRCKVEKNLKDITKTQKEEIFKTIKELPSLPISANLSQQDAHPIELLTKPKVKEFQSFSLAIETLKDIEPKQASKNKELENLNSILESQRQQLQDLEQKIVNYKEIGDMIYQNFTLIDELIKEVKHTKWKTDNKKILEKIPDEYKIIIEI